MAQASLSPRTAIAVASPTLLKSPAAQAAAVGVASSQLSAYVTIDPALTSWQQLGVTPIAENANTATVRLTLDALQRLAKQQGVEYIQITSGATQMLNLARQEAGTDQIHKGIDLPQAYTGKGVVVGVVDAGFDYMHAAFRRPADGALRIKRVWEQSATTLDGDSAPAKYGYGIELNTPELIEKAQGDSDSNSHGTHVAAIAAGSDAYKDGAYVGNAPDTDIVLVALDGLRQCIEKQETGCVSGAMPFNGTVRIADGNILLGFARDTQATLCITSMTGSTLFSKQLGKRSAGETLSVAVPQLPKGVCLLSVKTPTATKTFKFVWQ